jgi:pimeloyl-ACP methyl ester carboxylesterase
VGYIDLAGTRIWMTEEGSGEPVVLMHGGFGDTRDFDGNLSTLADRFRVVRYDRRGHGRTPDPGGSLSHHLMAEDTIALLEHLDAGPARLVGFSDGAVVALLAALRRPDLVERLVLVSGVHSSDGWLMKPDRDSIRYMPTELVDRYAEVSPDGREHFVDVAQRLADEVDEDLRVSDEGLAGLGVRTLVLVADDDLMSLEHSVALYRALPDAELAVVPGASHAVFREKPEQVTRLVREFLTTDAVPTIIPISRAPG